MTRAEVYPVPSAKLDVTASREALAELLEGRRRAGVRSADLATVELAWLWVYASTLLESGVDRPTDDEVLLAELGGKPAPVGFLESRSFYVEATEESLKKELALVRAIGARR